MDILKRLFFLAAVLAGSVQAAAPAPTLPASVVCYDDVFVPYFMPGNGTITGLNVDIMREAAQRAGVAIEFRAMPWRRLENELARGAAGTVDCAFALSRTAAREVYLDFGKVALQPTECALFVRDEAGAASTLDGLEGKVIATRAGFRLPEVVSAGAAAQRWHLEGAISDSTNFQKLALKRVDAVLADAYVGEYTLRQLHLPQVRRLAPALARFDTYLVFKKSADSAALSAAFDHALLGMRRDGSLQRISENFLRRAHLAATATATAAATATAVP